MHTTDIDQLCDNVAKALKEVKIGFRSQIDRSEVLDRFWRLQDHMARLVQSASDSREETFGVLKRRHPRLVSDSIDILSFIEKHRSSNASPLISASLAIGRSLETLEYLRQQSNVAAATG